MTVCHECRVSRSRADTARCASCGLALCPKHAHYYVDGQNAAITRAARPRCAAHAGEGA